MAAKPLPSTSVGWWALWLAAAVVLYPLYWSIFLLFPIAARQFVVVGLLIVAVAAIVTGGLALFRFRDQSVLLVTALVLMMLAASLFAVGELLLAH